MAEVSLEKARERANELSSAARAGRDLIADEEESRAVAPASRLTVEELIQLMCGAGLRGVCGPPRKSRAV